MTLFDSTARDRILCEKAITRIGALSEWNHEDRRRLTSGMNYYFGRLRKLRSLAVGQRFHAAGRLQSHVLKSFSGRLCAVLLEHSRRPHSGPLTIAEIEQRALQIDLFKKTSEPVRLWAQRKADGTVRTLMSPGPRRRESLRLLRQVLDARHDVLPDEFGGPAKGRDAAILRLKEMIETECIRHVVSFDLANFFPSVKPAHLRKLRLPEGVLRHTLLFNSEACFVHYGQMKEAKAARHGLPQGATTSGKSASVLLGRELQELPGAMGKVIYVDDVIIGACAPSDANEIAKALEKRFGNLSGGPLGFKKLDCADVTRGFAFLGYWFSAKLGPDKGTIVSLRPSHASFMKCRRRLHKRLRKAAADWDSALKIAQGYTEKWLGAFGLWNPGEGDLDDLELRVLEWVSDWFAGTTKKIAPPNDKILSD